MHIEIGDILSKFSALGKEVEWTELSIVQSAYQEDMRF